MPTIDPAKKQDQNWKRRYGIGRREYNKLLQFQQGMCATCGGQPDTVDEVFAIDHDHATGKVRGLLCKKCNTALGNVGDDPGKLARLKLYLETHQVRPTLPAIAGDSPQGPAFAHRTELGPAELEARDPRIPTPEVIAALKGHGLTFTEIAQEMDLDRPTVRQLYSESQRSSRVDNARDILLERALPSALMTIVQAVAEGDAKTSVALVKGLGVLRDRQEEKKEQTHGVGKPSFEEWRQRIISVERVTERVTVGPEQPALDAESTAAGRPEWASDSVIEADVRGLAADEAGVAPEGSGPEHHPAYAGPAPSGPTGPEPAPDLGAV